jgi:predicted outer membrane repeat protein
MDKSDYAGRVLCQRKIIITRKAMRLFLFSIWVSIYVLLLAQPALGQITRYVSTTGTNTNPASATTWASSTSSLQGAINSLTATGGQVWVRAGIYYPGGPTNTDPDANFSMRNNVAVYGGFVGNEATLNQRPAVNPMLGSPSSTTLSGVMSSTVSSNVKNVITNLNTNNTAILDGVVVMGGNSGQGGGGVFNNASSPTLTNCVFQSNTALGGGAIANQDSNPVLTNCLFQNNVALFPDFALGGGAIFNFNSSPTLTNCVFQNNSAAFGGAIYGNNNSNPSLTNCLLRSNLATNGGAIFNTGSSPVLTNCVLQSNSAINGGVIFSQTNSYPQLINCALQSNSATNGGVVYNESSSFPILTNCSLQGNVATQQGGVVYNSTGTSTGTNLFNCVVFGNGGSNTLFNTNGSTNASYTLFDNTVTGYLPGSFNLTTTTSPFVSTTSVALVAGSSAIEAGFSTAVQVASLPTVDLVGNPRVVGCYVDMGAIEYQVGLPTPPARLYVAASQTATAGDGLTWQTAFRDLQQALTYPCNRLLTEIWVAAGTYKPTSGTAQSSSFVLLPGVAVYGGFMGNETTLSQRPAISPIASNSNTARPSSSTLSGDIGAVGNNADNSYHVVSIGGITVTIVLDGFVITAGNANGGGFDNSGGAMVTGSGSLTLRNLTLQNNLATTNGGAIYGRGSIGTPTGPVLINCVFQRNSATNGGAMYNETNNRPTLTNCVFQSNSATSNGGAVYNTASSPGLINCVLQNNLATTLGGAVYNTNSSPTLTNCMLQSNSATNGGAMYNTFSSRPTLLNCSLQSNSATTSGGVIFSLNSSSPVLTNCVLFGNGGSNSFVSRFVSTTLTYSLFEPSSVTAGIDITGPGNLTATTSPFVSTTSVALAAGSLAINAGNPISQTVASGPYSATALPQTDLVGNPRIVGCRVDMGAVEVQSAPNAAMVTVQAGLWNDPATWSCGRVPVVIDPVRLLHAVTLPASYVGAASSIGYGMGGRLIYQTNAQLLLSQ